MWTHTLHKASISFSSIPSTLILLSEHNKTCSNSMKDKPLIFGLTSSLYGHLHRWFHGASNLSDRIILATEPWEDNCHQIWIIRSKKKSTEYKCKTLQRWWVGCSPSPRWKEDNAGPERNNTTNDTRLCGHIPEPLQVIRDDSQSLCVLTYPLSPPLTIFRIKKKKSNHPSWGCADSDRQLGQGGFGENTLWNETSSPVVRCPGAVKLKLKKLRVTKRLSHCSGKNLLNWCPQASSAETVSIQDCVIFSAISSFRAKWSTACSPHLNSQHQQRGQFWGKAKTG